MQREDLQNQGLHSYRKLALFTLSRLIEQSNRLNRSTGWQIRLLGESLCLVGWAATLWLQETINWSLTVSAVLWPVNGVTNNRAVVLPNVYVLTDTCQEMHYRRVPRAAKTPISFISVRSSVCISAASTKRISVKLYIGNLLYNPTHALFTL